MDLILMLIIIISLICMLTVCIAGLLTCVDENEDELKSSLKFLGISIFVCAVSTIALLVLQNHFDKIPYKNNQLTSTECITALQDNSEVNGVIHGGRYYSTGYFNEKLYYSYIVKLSDGGVVSNKVPAEGTTIYETNENFRVEWYIKTKSWLGMKDEVKSWKIYLPEGSVTDNYSIDLE